MSVPFKRGESIHTENSYKFTPDSVAEMLGRAGFSVRKEWSDAKKWFGVYLAEAGENRV